MEDRIRALPLPAEFLLVVCSAFGYLILKSFWIAFVSRQVPVFTEHALRITLVYELLVFALVYWFLRVRGWSLRDFRLDPDWPGVWQGLVLAVLIYGFDLFLWSFAAGLVGYHFRYLHVQGVLELPTVVAVSVINPLFEELLVTGYVISRLKSLKHPAVAIHVSVLIRFLYHVYQGPIAVVWIIPMGLLFAYWYMKMGKLWPLVVAHAALDFVAFVPYAGR